MPRITITLQTDEREALKQLAERERRDGRQQAAMLIRRELERCGLLPKSVEVDRERNCATANACGGMR